MQALYAGSPATIHVCPISDTTTFLAKGGEPQRVSASPSWSSGARYCWNLASQAARLVALLHFNHEVGGIQATLPDRLYGLDPRYDFPINPGAEPAFRLCNSVHGQDSSPLATKRNGGGAVGSNPGEGRGPLITHLRGCAFRRLGLRPPRSRLSVEPRSQLIVVTACRQRYDWRASSCPDRNRQI